MNVKTRQHIERKIASAFITAALRDGKSIAVDNGEAETVYPYFHRAKVQVRSIGDAASFEATKEQYEHSVRTVRKQILSEMFHTDDERLLIGGIGNNPEGWAYLVYGNDGYDVISDYTVNLEYLMIEPNRVSNKYENLYVR